MILKSANIQRTDLYLVSFYGAPMKPYELFCFKDTIKFRGIIIFLSGMQEKIPAGKCAAIPICCKCKCGMIYVTLIRDFFCHWNNHARLY